MVTTETVILNICSSIKLENIYSVSYKIYITVFLKCTTHPKKSYIQGCFDT